MSRFLRRFCEHTVRSWRASALLAGSASSIGQNQKTRKSRKKVEKKRGVWWPPLLSFKKSVMLRGRRAGKARIQGLLFAAGVVTACCERFLLGCTRAQRPQTGSRAVGFAASSAGPCAGTGCAGVPPPSRGAWHFTAAMRLRGGFARRWVTVEVGENAVCA